MMCPMTQGDAFLTRGALSKRAGVHPNTTDKYAASGELKFVVASDGKRLYRPDQADRLRELAAIGRSRTGRPPKAQAGT
jgi:DNA-binding transcriptional MerR regulator